MIALELKGVEIDHCLSCGGIWLDAGELEMLLGEAPRANELITRPVGKGRSARHCPICNQRMEIIAFHSEKKVALDRCREGHGLWFDKGELEEVCSLLPSPEGEKIRTLLRDMFNRK
jgi:Zn-finger nucleic acid-binding protein